jgi:site-specific recombinase XerD
MHKCGLETMTTIRHSSFHLLRHSCANRWWALGVVLLDITHRLGHHSVDIAIQTYLHIAPFLQKEQLEYNKVKYNVWLSRRDIATLLGISVRHLRNLLDDLKDDIGLDIGNKSAVREVTKICSIIQDRLTGLVIS